MKLLFCSLALASSAAHAANAGDTDLLRCLAITEGPARLACYDTLASAVRDAKTVTLATTTAAPAPPSNVAENFGRPAVVLAPATKVLESRVDGPIDGWRPDSRIRLVNGQVWQVGDGNAAFATLESPKISIRPGLFGSYFLEVEGLSFQVRVKRVQ